MAASRLLVCVSGILCIPGCGLLLDLGAPEEGVGIDAARDAGLDVEQKDTRVDATSDGAVVVDAVTSDSTCPDPGPCRDTDPTNCDVTEICEVYERCLVDDRDPSGGTCVPCLIDPDCGGGEGCGGSRCIGNVCQPPMVCDDGISCTMDFCDDGVCRAMADDTACDEGTVCGMRGCVPEPECIGPTSCMRVDGCLGVCEGGTCDYPNCGAMTNGCVLGVCTGDACESRLRHSICTAAAAGDACVQSRCQLDGTCRDIHQPACGAIQGECLVPVCVPDVGCRHKPDDSLCPAGTCGPRGECIAGPVPECSLALCLAADPCTGICEIVVGGVPPLSPCRVPGHEACVTDTDDPCDLAFCGDRGVCRHFDLCDAGLAVR